MTATTAQAGPARPAALLAISIETLVYLAIVTAALILRAIRLGEPLLGEWEASQALAAHHLVQTGSGTPGVIESPVTLGTLALSFALAGASSGAARFMPMLAGLGLVLSPLLFRDRLGRTNTLITTALLAVSPTAVAASRVVGGYSLAMLALVVSLWAIDRHLGSGRSRWLSLAGMMLGIALLSDYAALAAAVAALLGAVYAFFTDEEGKLEEADLAGRLRAVPWRLFVIALAATMILVSTLFFVAPNGLGAAADLIARFGRGLFQHPVGVAWLGITLGVYELGLLVFGVIGTWRASQSHDPFWRFLAGMGFAALLLVALYPGALPGHALWAVLPLAPLAALGISSLLRIEEISPRWVPWTHAAGVLALFGMTVVSIAQHVRLPYVLTYPPNPVPGQATIAIPINLVLAGVWLVMQVVLWFSISYMWDSRTALRGLGLGLVLLHGISSVGQSGALSLTRSDSPYEPLHITPAQPGLSLLAETARDISSLAEGNPVDATITVQASPDGALAWALRDFHNISFVDRADPTVDTIMVVTPADGADPALGSAYVGQDFVTIRAWSPSGLTPSLFFQWLLYRTAPTPTQDTRFVLWVREDIYRLSESSQ